MEQKSTPTEKKIDKALEDTFPASDPPSVSGKTTREERVRRDAEEKQVHRDRPGRTSGR